MTATRNRLARARSARAFAMLCLFPLLGACRGPEQDDTAFNYYAERRDSVSIGAGNAQAHNLALQTIDPWPREASDTRIDVDGEVMAKAIQRYKDGKVKQPKGLQTQAVSTTPTEGK